MACLAMISGRDYAVVRADMPPAQIEHGLADNTVLWWLNRQAIWSRRSWTDGEGARPIPRVGTAICLTRDAHWIVLTDGMVLDPARETPLAHYEITQVIEVFPLASLPEDRRDRDGTITIRRAVLFAAYRAVYEARRILDTAESPLGHTADEARRLLRMAFVAMESPEWKRLEQLHGGPASVPDREGARGAFRIWQQDFADVIAQAEFDHLSTIPAARASEETR